MLFFNKYSLDTYCVPETALAIWVTVTNKTDKIPYILLVLAHLTFTVTLQCITLQITYEKLKKRLRNLPMATQLENGVKHRLESKVFPFLTAQCWYHSLLCVCEYIRLCVYIYKHTHTHVCVCTRLDNFLSSSTSARVETEPSWWPVNSQCWEQHLTHSWSSINIY